jgi:hypothetical protein
MIGEGVDVWVNRQLIERLHPVLEYRKLRIMVKIERTYSGHRRKVIA